MSTITPDPASLVLTGGSPTLHAYLPVPPGGLSILGWPVHKTLSIEPGGTTETFTAAAGPTLKQIIRPATAHLVLTVGALFSRIRPAAGSLQITGGTASLVSFKIVSAPPPRGRIGHHYSYQIQVEGGTAPYTYSVVGALPTGLALDTSTGIISGTPTQNGIWSFGVRAIDAAGRRAG